MSKDTIFSTFSTIYRWLSLLRTRVRAVFTDENTLAHIFRQNCQWRSLKFAKIFLAQKYVLYFETVQKILQSMYTDKHAIFAELSTPHRCAVFNKLVTFFASKSYKLFQN